MLVLLNFNALFSGRARKHPVSSDQTHTSVWLWKNVLGTVLIGTQHYELVWEFFKVK